MYVGFYWALFSGVYVVGSLGFTWRLGLIGLVGVTGSEECFGHFLGASRVYGDRPCRA